RLVIKKEALNIKKVIENAVIGLAPGAEAKGLRVVSKIDKNLPRVIGDDDRLTEVLNNLLGNSIKYTDEGQILVEGKLEGNFVKVAVTDTGIGIPKLHLRKIFEKFYRGDESLARVAGGTGLGLAIAKGIISVLEGQIWAESEGEGRGTSFIFTIPIV
ncbi:sensor histidine kinase, partial [Candidatus Margulisiibacteriota bacterium]